MSEEIKAADSFALATQKINAELAFNVRAISSNAEHFVINLTKAKDSIAKIITDLEQCVAQQKENLAQTKAESMALYMIPEKIQQRISAIVPEIAQQVANIYNSKSQEIEQQHELLLNKLSQATDCFEQKITDITDKSLSKLADATNQCSATIEANLNRYSTQLMQDATTATTNNRSKFFNNLAIMVVFAAIVSALTSYVVASQFPRYIEINRANDLSIYDSKVQVWGGKINEEKDSGKK